MRAPGQQQVEVELVEAGTEEVPPAERGADWRELLARVPRRVRVLVAGAVVLAVAVWAGTVWQAERALTARLARVDHLTVPLSEPLVEQWRAPGDHAVAVVGDVLVLLGGNGGSSARGVALADGEVRWETGDLSAWCWLVRVGAPEAGDAPSAALPEAAAGAAVLACSDTGSERPGASSDPRSEVRVLDPVSGELLREIVLPGTGWPNPVGDDVLAIGADGDGALVGSRWSVLTGEQVWEHHGGPVDADDVEAPISVDDETVTVGDGAGAVSLDLRTGEPVDRVPAERREREGFTLPDGGAVVLSQVDAGRLDFTVRDPDGSERFTGAGYPFRPTVDDGTWPGALLVYSAETPGILAVDARTGDELWRARATFDVAVLAGTVLLREEARTAALDPRSGRTVWEHTDRSVSGGWGLVTDGRSVLTLAEADAELSLVVRDVATGELRWSSTSPLPLADLRPLPDGRVLLQGGGETVVLAP